jgi:hypothetical protein
MSSSSIAQRRLLTRDSIVPEDAMWYLVRMRITLCLLVGSGCLLPMRATSEDHVTLTYRLADQRVETVTHPLVQDGTVQRFCLPASEIPAGVKSIEVLPDFATAKTGEDGYFMMPNGFIGTFRQQDGEEIVRRIPMPIHGMKTLRSTFVAIVTGMPHAYRLVARAKAGVYTVFPRFELDQRGAYDDLAIEYHMLSGKDANYSGMARTYRAYQLERGACVPLKQRMETSPELAYAARSVEIRIRLGWKPAPSPVEEQTLATEPEMKAVVTFDRVGEILDELKRQGVKHAQICLVGWNRKGHDGRYPQLFPVEEKLGGEQALKRLIKKAQKMGYQIVGHTNSTDAYRISEAWDEEYIIKKADGTLSKNSCWSGGRMYNICPKCSYERFAVKDLPAVAALGFRGAHYIDVLSIVRPRNCFDPNHPLNADESAAWLDEIMHLGKKSFGAVASEGPFDFCCGNLDYALYVTFDSYSRPRTDMIDYSVPIWQLVYHGIILSNPFSKTTNYTIKDDLAKVKLAEYGGRPLFYFNSKFVTTKKNWMGDEDITCGTDQELKVGVTAIKAGFDDYQRRLHLQSEFMQQHDMLAPNVSRTVYSDGFAILANYSHADFTYEDTVVKAMSYAVVKSPQEARACIEYSLASAVDTFHEGALLFTNRKYVVKDVPAWLCGKLFLRGSIDRSDLRVTRDGVLFLLTPDPAHERATTQVKALEALGFTRVVRPETFQLFGSQPFDQVRIYRKQVKAGDRLTLGKWAVAVGFDEAVPKPVKPWSENDGERLYNGIVLPKEWPPRTIDPGDSNPMPVPYLDHPPKAIPISVGRQLFVDGFLVETTDLARTFHMPVKFDGNPVLRPETDLEKNGDFNDAAVPKSGGVWWDPTEKLFKMWYEAGWIHTICYATSRDGLHWDRPSLDVVPDTNQVLPPDLTPDSWTVVPDWDAADSIQRYKLYMRPPGGQMPGVSMISSDGIHWTNRVATGDCGDRSTMFYNPFRKKWVYSLRSSFRGRSRHYREHDDFLEGATWSGDEPVVWAAADKLDPPDPEVGRTAQLYNLDAVAYESIMLGMFEIHRGPPNNLCMDKGLPKITELNLAYSRDGFHWHRPDRRAHIPAERRDVWDRAYVQPIGNICTVYGDELRIYYTGFQGDTNRLSSNWLKNGMYDRGATGFATLRRDGFASMDADGGSGTLTTRPVTFSGRHLFVNLAAPDGSLRVEVLDDRGQSIAPFTHANCRPLAVDSTLAQITWKGGDDLSSLGGKPVRFRFALTTGSLYAFWVSRDKTGRSDGYVAGGGPGYTGLKDTVGRAALAAAQRE